MDKFTETKKTLTARDIFDEVKEEENKELELAENASTKEAIDKFHKKMLENLTGGEIQSKKDDKQ